ncbi:MAG: hypothetical protein AAGF54_19210 [Pseudomonadota bacterium]
MSGDHLKSTDTVKQKKGCGCLWVFPSMAALIYALYWIYFSPFEWRQKITITIDTPSGVISESTVHHIRLYKDRFRIFPSATGGSRIEVRGEAIVMKLPNGRYLFGLRSARLPAGHMLQSGDILIKHVAANIARRTLPAVRIAYETPVGARFILPELIYPILVTFDDPQDPKSIKLVRPGSLSKVFGAGYKIRDVTLEITLEEPEFGKVKPAVDYFWWPEEKRHAYACEAYGCNRFPMRLFLPDGRYETIRDDHFIEENFR